MLKNRKKYPTGRSYREILDYLIAELNVEILYNEA